MVSKKCLAKLKAGTALVGVAQWIECGPVNQRVAGSIPSQGTCLGCGPGPQLGACEGQPINISPLLFPSLTLSLKINKILGKKKAKADL